MELIVTDENGETGYLPIVQEGIEWSTSRRGTPGKLTFKVLQDGALPITEGSNVQLKVDGKNVFRGFVFSLSWDKSKEISVCAYDQLRYLQNKDTFQYTDTASGLLRMLAADYQLTTGDIADSGYVIANRVESNKSLFEMIENALDMTMLNTNKLFVMYDNFGKIELKDMKDMELGLVIDEETGENYDYQSSIDHDTYNQIKLVYENEEAGIRDVYMTMDSANIGRWGVLQYFDTVQEGENGQVKADKLLELYNQKSRKLKISNALGDIRVRAGSRVIVNMDFGEIKLQNLMLAEDVSHTFNNQEHLMNLTLRGGEFSA